MTNQTPFPCQALADEVAHLKAYRDSLPPTTMVPVGQTRTGETKEEEKDNPEIPAANAKIREAEGRLQQCVDSFTKRADVRLEDTRAIVLSPGGLEIQAPSVTAKLPNGQQVDLLAGRGSTPGADVSKDIADLRAQVDLLRSKELADLRAQVDLLRSKELADLRAEVQRLRSQIGGGPGIKSTATSGPGVEGRSSGDAGVKGFRGDPSTILFDERGAPILDERGVPKRGDQPRFAGVFGWSGDGAGVHGVSVAGPGVKAESRDGPALQVLGKAVINETLAAKQAVDTPWLEVKDVNAKGTVSVAETLTAKKVEVKETLAAKRLRAESSSSPALEVVGDMAFSRCGWVVIPPGTQTAEVPASLNARTMVLAVVRGAGPEWVQGAWGQQAATSSIQIRLNQPASQSVVVGWFLIEAAEAHPFYRPPEPPRGAAAEVM